MEKVKSYGQNIREIFLQAGVHARLLHPYIKRVSSAIPRAEEEIIHGWDTKHSNIL